MNWLDEMKSFLDQNSIPGNGLSFRENMSNLLFSLTYSSLTQDQKEKVEKNLKKEKKIQNTS